MAAQNWQQKFLTNPISTNTTGDLLYFARSPYGVTNDAVITWANFAAQFLQPANNLSEITNPAAARGNLGLQSMAIQAANAVAITGGSAILGTLSAGFIYANLTGSAVLSPTQTNVIFSYVTAGIDLSDGLGLASFVNGFKISLKNNSIGNVTFTPFPGDTIDGDPSLLLAPQEGVLIIKTSTQWSIIARENNSSGSVSSGLINQVAWYAATGSVISGLATLANAALVTNAASVPSLSTTLPNAVQSNITRLGTQVVALNMGAQNIVNALNLVDINNQNIIALNNNGLGSTSWLQITNNPPATGPDIVAQSSGANTNLRLWTKGTGQFTFIQGASNITNPVRFLPNGGGGSEGIFTWGTLTANRTYTFQDASGTLAFVSQIPLVGPGLINQLAYFAVAGSNISGLPTANNAMFVTSNSGVPSVTSILGQGISIASSVMHIGEANNIIFNDGKGIQDSNGNPFLLFTKTAAAVNFLQISNAPTGGLPGILATGADANVNMNISVKGNGEIALGNNGGANNIALFGSTAGTIVNYPSFTASTAGNGIGIGAVGTDANINMIYSAKGSGGNHIFAAGTSNILTLNAVAAAVNSFAMTASSTGNGVTFTATGADPNVNMNLGIKGSTSSFVFLSSVPSAPRNLLTLTPSSTPANYITINSSNTTVAPSIVASGTDANVLLQLNGQGNLGVGVQGTSTNNDAIAGNVGEYIESIILSGSAVSLVNATAKTITSVSLTPGDWNVWAEFSVAGGATTTLTLMSVAVSPTTNVIPTFPDGAVSFARMVSTTSASWVVGSTGVPYLALTPARIKLSATTSYFLVASCNFAVSTLTGYGKICARRVR